MHSSPRLYKTLKTIWLLAHVTILPASAVFLVSTDYFTETFGAALANFALIFGGGALMVLWLIGMALLGMYRFPLDIYSAARMVFLLILQFTVLAFLGGNVLFSFYSTFFTSSVAIVFIFFAVGFMAISTGKIQLKYWSLLVLIAASACILLFFAFQPIMKNLVLMNIAAAVVSGFLMLSNVINSVISLYRLSVFSKAPDLRRDLDKEWESWAPITIILLILSLVTAAILGGILQT